MMTLRGKNQVNPLPVEGLEVRDDLMEQWGELVEELISITLVEVNPIRIVQVSLSLDKEVTGILPYFF